MGDTTVTKPDSEATPPAAEVVAIIETVPGVSVEEGRRKLAQLVELEDSRQRLLAELANIYSDTGARRPKKIATVLSLIQFLIAVSTPEFGYEPTWAALDLLDSIESKPYRDTLRGMIASAVALLRASGLKNPEIEEWLDKEISDRNLRFQASHAMRWYYDCIEEKAGAPSPMIEAFKSFVPKVAQAPTVTEAKLDAINRLEIVRWSPSAGQFGGCAKLGSG